MNLSENKLDIYLQIYDVAKSSSYYLTRTGRPFTFHWLDEETIAVMKANKNNEFQIFIFENLIGEGLQVTAHEGGIEDFFPFAEGFVYLANNLNQERKNRKEKFGNFIHVEEEKSTSSAFYINATKIKRQQLLKNTFNEAIIDLGKFLPETVKIVSIVPSPNNDMIFLNCRCKDDLVFEYDASNFQIQFKSGIISSEPNQVPIISQLNLPQGAKIVAVSPDGSKLLILSKKRDNRDFTQADLWILSHSDLEKPNCQDHMICLTDKFDHDPLTNRIYWTKAGIYFIFWKESRKVIAKLSENGKIEEIDLEGFMPDYWFHVNDAGDVSFPGVSSTSINDVYLSRLTTRGRELTQLTDFNKTVENWDLGTVESIKWTSKDGTEIEGILRKPSNFDHTKKYPILFNIHGGPHAASANVLLEGMDQFYYPVVQFSIKDILVLKINYRGSLGKGQAFKELLVNNVGVGDLWDLESAIDHLINLGYIDETKIGICGGSQGAYISAFAAMHSNRFCAASGCSTLSSWVIYFYGSDMRYSIPFSGSKTYRSGAPFENGMDEIFEKTAPITGLENSNTPMLLQHGEIDERVPLYSSKMLYRALKEKGVQTELFVFPEMGHSINKPRENYAILTQNYRWFLHHFLGEELDFYKDDER